MAETERWQFKKIPRKDIYVFFSPIKTPLYLPKHITSFFPENISSTGKFTNSSGITYPAKYNLYHQFVNY